jgi:hypothetical protein
MLTNQSREYFIARLIPRHIYACNDMLLCMRTTVDINDSLLQTAKKRAADENATLKEIVDRALRQYLAGVDPKRKFKLNWKPHKGGGHLQPGVVVEDRDNLFDVMEGRH